jgi:hypothetical protein
VIPEQGWAEVAWFDSRSATSVTAAHPLVGVVGQHHPFVDVYGPAGGPASPSASWWSWNICEPCHAAGAFDPAYETFIDTMGVDHEDHAAAAIENRISAYHGE